MEAPLLREQHLEWCRRRALQYAEHGELANAVMFFACDLEKHPETASDALSNKVLAEGMDFSVNQDKEGVIQWIKEFK